MVYTTNLVPNPSFEVDLTNYTALGIGTTISQSPDVAQWSSYSMQVVTDGSITGQGFKMAGISASAGSYSFSLYLNAATNTVPLNIVVASNPGGQLVTQKAVTVTQGWNRYTIPGFTLPSGANQFYVYVTTTSATASTFYVDGLQLEPSATVTDYCDGNLYGCQWTGTPNASSSTRDVRFALIADAQAQSLATLAYYIPQIPIQLTAASVASSIGTLTVQVQNPQAVFNSFAMYRSTDPDPAQSYVVASNAGTVDAAQNASSWTRHWMLVVPPVDTYGGNNAQLWKRAAYAAVGFRFASMLANDWHYIDSIQFEIYPVNTNVTIGPTAYQTPRLIQTTVKPNRLNHGKNPSFETSTNNWSFHGTTTGGYGLTRDNSVTAKMGSWSGKCFLSNDGQSYCQTIMDSLISGRSYTVSAYIRVATGGALKDVVMNATFAQKNVFYSTFATPLPSDSWVRVSMTFKAAQSSETIAFIPTFNTGFTSATFWVDGFLCEEGTVLGTYFDGGYGYDYLWETSGTPGECRSYYYQGRRYKTYFVTDAVTQNTPVGISSQTPQFAIPYQQ